MADRRSRKIRRERLRDAMRALQERRLAGEKKKHHEIGHHHGVGVRRGVVLSAAQTHNDVRTIVGGEGLAASSCNPVVPIERRAPALGGGQKGSFVGRLEQTQRRPDHVGIVAGGG